MAADEQQRALLTEHLERIRARVGKLEAELDALIRARRGESDDDEHDPEGETLSAQWSMRKGLLESARADAKLGAQAMQRLDAGDYGICVSCLAPIPIEQLEVRPFRDSCVRCASRSRA